MSKELRLLLRQLVPKSMTRIRGQEAAEALRKAASVAQASRVCLDMRTDSLVTTSFIDELVRQAAEMEREGLEIVFLVTGPEMMERFQTSVNWRRISCRYRLPDESVVRTLRPAAVQEPLVNVETGAKPQLPATG